MIWVATMALVAALVAAAVAAFAFLGGYWMELLTRDNNDD